MQMLPRTTGQLNGSLERVRTAASTLSDKRKRRLAVSGQTNRDRAIHCIPSATRYTHIHLRHVQVEWAAEEPLKPVQEERGWRRGGLCRHRIACVSDETNCARSRTRRG